MKALRPPAPTVMGWRGVVGLVGGDGVVVETMTMGFGEVR